MNTDIRLDIDLLSNTKIKRLIRRKGYTGFYNLISLWIYAAKHRPEGVFYDLYNDDLMDAAATSDETFINLLVEIGLLDIDPDWLKIHEWGRHNPWAIGSEKRAESARKAAKARWARKGKAS